MSHSLKQRVADHYSPLLRGFIDTLSQVPLPEGELMPEPFLPHFGKGYEKSPMRLAIIGQDTRYWGDLRAFLADPGATDGSRYGESLSRFQNHQFTDWAGTRYDFHGFVLWFLASLYGRTDWTSMKHGAMTEILDSFAWGNLNAVELHSSSPSKEDIPRDYWEKVRAAGSCLDRFSHVVATLAPRVAVILCRGLNPESYFEGLDYEIVSTQGRFTHFRTSNPRIDILNAPHPGNMKYDEGADHFRESLEAALVDIGFNQIFPAFLASQEEGVAAMDYLRINAPTPGPDFDKFEFIAWVAEELMKRNTFMSVPALAELLNSKGYRSDRGEEFGAGRGGYVLVSAAYARFDRPEHPKKAHNIAVAFRRPNFEYAYPCD